MKNKHLKIDKKEVHMLISSYFQEIQKSIELLKSQEIEAIIEIIINAYNEEKTIYILGNGGSSSISTHFACDLGKGTLRRVYDSKEKRLRVISLTDNIALITAYSNDISYNNIFVQQLQNLVGKDDVVIGISGSGNSENVLKAIRYAKKVGAKTVAFTGFDTGGKLASIVDSSIVVKSNHYGPIEDTHHILGHIIASVIASIKHQERRGSGKSQENKAVPFRI